MSKKIDVFKPKEKFLLTITGPITKEHLNYKYALGMTIGNTRHNVYADYNLSCQKETHGSKTYWFINGDKREFKSEEDILAALNELCNPIRTRLAMTVVNPLGNDLKISLKKNAET